MKMNIYAIRDVHTGFMSPTIDQNDASAVRNFKHASLNYESLFYTHTKDYDLFCIGEYESETGEIVPCVPPRLVVAGSSLEV
uniref:Nonstructural protein n=1 Tax=Dulem virus 130 TaxID=3145607 RepID=A0AAU8B9P6_9VIRU